jgi:hypothetical protein
VFGKSYLAAATCQKINRDCAAANLLTLVVSSVSRMRHARPHEPAGVTPSEKVHHPPMDNKPNPYLLGFSIGICFGLALLVSFLWFPWIGDAKYKQLRDLLFFSVGMFVILIGRYWNVRRVPKLWLALSILASAHSVGYWLYITHVGSLSPLQLILITACEMLPAVFFINWFARLSIDDDGTPKRNPSTL